MQFKKKLFIVLDGPEGGGKSTQIQRIAAYLSEKNVRVLVTKEPGGTDPVCADIRSVLLDAKHSGKFHKRAELLLFCGDRAQHVEYVIKPALEPDSKYDLVLCDRYEAVMYAYQYYARAACSSQEFNLLNGYATQGLLPDFTFILDVTYEIGLERNKKTGKGDRFEIEGPDFHNKGREGFTDYCQKVLFPGTYAIINADNNADQVFECMKKYVDAFVQS